MSEKRAMTDDTKTAFAAPLHAGISPERAGGKATNLAAVEALGLRVPTTVVLSREALSAFLRVNDLESTIREYEGAFEEATNRVLADRYQRICQLVRGGAIPEDVRAQVYRVAGELLNDASGGLAVRSSALMEDSEKASFAGVFESYLGVTTPAGVLEHVRRVWCSLWAPKAVRYRHKMGLEPEIDGMAVLIQKVVAARCAGVVHTADPATGNPWRFVLHATHGLSADLMSGSGAGDRSVQDWQTGAILQREIGRKSLRIEARDGTVQETPVEGDAALRPALDDSDAAKIAAMAGELDEAFAMRMDIEWAMDEEGLVVVQARPLTGLPEFFPHTLSEEETQKKWWASGFHAVNQPEAEFIPPLFMDLSGQEMWTRYHPNDFVFYADPGKEEMDVSGYRYATVTKWRSFSDYIKGAEATELWMDENEESYRSRWTRFEAELDEIRQVSSEAIRETTTALELIPTLLGVRDHWADLCSVSWGAPQSWGGVCEELLSDFCREHVSPDFVIAPLLHGGAGSFTFRTTKALQQLARSIHEDSVRDALMRLPASAIIAHLQASDPNCAFLAAFEHFCWEFGRRPPSWETRPPIWSECGIHPRDRSPFWRAFAGKHLQALSGIKQELLGQSRDVEETQKNARQRRAADVKRVRDALAKKDASLLERFDKIHGWALLWTQALNDRHAGSIAHYWLYELIWQVGHRLCQEDLLDEPADVLALYREDLEEGLGRADRGGFRETVRDRIREHARNRRLTPPKWLGARPDRDYWEVVSAQTRQRRKASPDVPERVFHGVGNWRGETTGIARRTEEVDDPAFFDSVSREDIVVLTVPMASPFADWHSLLMIARGVVSAGKPYQHLVQVANECDIPLITSVEEDLAGIPDRAQIRIDSAKGEICVLGETEASARET
jgi:phosphohistidine swiveling domain-containing protein